MSESILLSTIAVAFLHALAPDHWTPFVAIAKARRWSIPHLLCITALSGLGHVGSSIGLGASGIILGVTLTSLTAIESSRGAIAGLLLVGFGLAYCVWGLKHWGHAHAHPAANKTVTVWALVAIFVLGPCEPLIPLMFLGIQYGWQEVWLVSLIFGLTTISMMLVQTVVAYKGLRLLLSEKLDQWTHVTCGLIIAGTGAVVMFLGI
jgi:sulfite exporter TauE/SafE